MLSTLRFLTVGWCARVRSERAATVLEYAIVASAIAAVIVLAVGFLGRSTEANFDCTQASWSTRTERC